MDKDSLVSNANLAWTEPSHPLASLSGPIKQVSTLLMRERGWWRYERENKTVCVLKGGWGWSSMYACVCVFRYACQVLLSVSKFI